MAFPARSFSVLAVLVLALIVLCAEIPQARAQWGDGYDAPQGDFYGSPPPRRRYRDSYYDDRDYRRPAPRRYQPQEPPRQYYWPWEEQPQRAQPQAPAPTYSRPARPPRPKIADEARPPRPRSLEDNAARPKSSDDSRPRPPSVSATTDDSRPVRKRLPRPAPVPVEQAAPAPKTAPNTQVAVFGDSLASYLSKGLDQAFADIPDVEVIDRSRGDSGIVRKDVVDWPKAAEDYLKANPKTAYALFMVGVNDRQPLREGDQTYDPLSEKWRELYISRIDAIIKVFADRKIPLVWVSLPPVRSDSLSRDLATINDIVRERVQKSGQTYVDVWPGFVDDRNRYTPNGPDVDGQDARLRTSDGIHFTNAGSRKVGHFADVELKRMMGANPSVPPAVAATPPAEGTPGENGAAGGVGLGLDDTSTIDRRITTMLPSLPEPPGIPSLPVKPAAGPVVPLGRAELSPGGTLTSGRPRDATGTAERSLQRGVAPLPQPGRADDFRWPPG